MGQNNQSEHQHHHHHILPTRVAVGIGVTLLFLTAVTVWVAHVDLGALNFVVAMAVASFKASLVAIFFMNLKHDRRENAMIFATSFLFLAIFIILTGTDMFFRGDVYVKGPLAAPAGAASKLKNPWVSTPELVKKGKELYAIQCATCHGIEGKGNGPAAAALNPPPRDFTATTGWKNGRKPTMVFKTLKEGLPPSAMASYATLPADDRWALTHYVLSLAPNPEQDTPADFTKAGINPAKGGAEEAAQPTISVDLAMRQMAVPEMKKETLGRYTRSAMPEAGLSAGAQVYRAQCLECHGPQGQGGVGIQSLGVIPTAYVTTSHFQLGSEGLRSQDAFNQLVIRGLPGEMMPGNGQLSATELRDLYQFVRGLAR